MSVNLLKEIEGQMNKIENEEIENGEFDNSKERLKRKRIRMKKKLLSTYPNARCYKFANPVVRDMLFRNVYQADEAYSLIVDFWGIYINDDEKAEIDKILNSARKIAYSIIGWIEKINEEEAKRIMQDFKNSSKEECVKLIEESDDIYEVLATINRNLYPIYKAMIYVDKFNTFMKSGPKGKEWNQLVYQFEKELENVLNKSVELLSEKKVPKKYLGRFVSILKKVIELEKNGAENGN